MTVLSDACPDCGRLIVETGVTYHIETALDRNGESLAAKFLDNLASRKRDRDRLADILIRLEAFAKTGTLLIPRQLNQLSDELWEVKAGTLRLPFYYRHDAPCGQVRLTHGFIKRSQTTPRGEIELGHAIIREDKKR